MVFKNGEKKIPGKMWNFEGEEIQIVSEFKYLGFYFRTRNKCKRQKDMLAGKAQKAANIILGLMKRTGKNRVQDRLKLMNSLVRSVALHGIEIWGWGDCKQMCVLQGRYCKMAIGVEKNTPKYIWRRKLDVPDIKYIIRERV